MNTVYLISVISIIEFVALITLSIILLNKRKKKNDEVALEQIEEQHSGWAMALHNKYSHQWMDVFSNLNYPLDDISRRNILVLLWEISSKTIDCLMLEHNDPNLLQRHRDSVEFLIGESDQWNNLKEFHRDPSTVPHQVIAIYDILKEIDFKGEVVAFGYKITIG